MLGKYNTKYYYETRKKVHCTQILFNNTEASCGDPGRINLNMRMMANSNLLTKMSQSGGRIMQISPSPTVSTTYSSKLECMHNISIFAFNRLITNVRNFKSPPFSLCFVANLFYFTEC